MPETKHFTHTIKLSPGSSHAGQDFEGRLAYWSLGDASKPTVLMPTCFAGKLETTTPFLYDSDTSALPLSEYHVLVVGQLGGGESSSPSNQPAPFSGVDFPRVTYEDNIHLQHALCQSLGVKHLEAYIGFSMGGQQAYHMAVLYPDFVSNIVMLATSARTSAHNWNFLEGPKAALESSVDFENGRYKIQPTRGLRAFGRVYSTWALSQEWYRQECWKATGYDTLEQYLQNNWDKRSNDANDLLSMLWTWQHGDITSCFTDDKGDLPTTLGRIKAKCAIMPSKTDMYFPPEDSEEEVKHVKNGKLAVIPSIYGHLADAAGAFGALSIFCFPAVIDVLLL
ncbi:homoserine acetyltransferase, partial [Aureobasidium pullulans]